MKKTNSEILKAAEYILKNNNIPEKVVTWIMSELHYQAKSWNKDTTTTSGLHDPFEFNLFIKNYNDEAINFLSRNLEPVASEFVINNLRKISALVVSCLMQNHYSEYLKTGLFSDHKYLKTTGHALTMISHWTTENEKQIIFESEIGCVINLVYILDTCVSLLSKPEFIDNLYSCSFF